MRRGRGGSCGYILLEVLTAALFINAALLAALATFTISAPPYSLAWDYTVAANFGQQTMESLKAGRQPPAIQVRQDKFRITWNERPLGAGNLYYTQVKVSWLYRQEEQAVELVTYLERDNY